MSSTRSTPSSRRACDQSAARPIAGLALSPRAPPGLWRWGDQLSPAHAGGRAPALHGGLAGIAGGDHRSRTVTDVRGDAQEVRAMKRSLGLAFLLACGGEPK